MTATTALETIKAARKPHVCEWCAERIDAGSTYQRYRYFNGREAATVRLHPECNLALEETVRDEGYDYEFMRGENPRGCTCGFSQGCKTCEGRSRPTTREGRDKEKSE